MEFLVSDENGYINKEYENDNYLVEDLDNSTNNCIIFCSGNGIYYPNDVDTFNNIIVTRDRYECKKYIK